VTARLRSAALGLYRISDRIVYLLFAIGVLSSPFYRVGYLREHLLGTAVVPATAAIAVLALGLCVAWRSLLRRDFVWAQPAQLTWSDSADTRVRLLGRRLWSGWAARFAAVAYLTAVAVLLLGPATWLPAGAAVFAGVMLLAVVLARRPAGRVATSLAYLGVAVTLALAAVAAVTTVGTLPLWVLAGATVLAAGLTALGSGPPRRPAVATGAGRDDLVAGYRRRTVRQVTVLLGDALALLPPPAPLPWARLLAGRAVIARFVVAGVLTRARSVLLAVFCVVLIVVVHQVFPVLSPLWLVGVGAYLAGVPFASSLAQLWAVPGLRRWLACRDITLRLVTAAAVLVAVASVIGVIALFGVPVTLVAWLAVPLTVGAAVRTVTRPPVDYGNVGLAVTPSGYVLPVGIIVQLAHGPELLVIGLLIVGSGLALAAAAPLVLGLAAYGVAR
jgi:hypothetical protein